MLYRMPAAFSLMALCVVLHAAGIAVALRWIGRKWGRADTFRRWTWLFVRLATWIVALHMVEITVWAWFFVFRGAIPDLQTAIYFSAATYTTTGYGDVVLPAEWQLAGSVESLTGILMCGWSTGFFFAIVSRIVSLDAHGTQT